MKKAVLVLLAFLSVGVAVYGQNTVSDTLGFRTAAAGNAVELLRGQIAGVRVSSIDGNPVGAVNVHIRGLNSLRTDNQPLWIVDGVMVSTDLNENLDAFWQYDEQSYTSPLNPLAFLNADEVESIEVLKDASATAIYGSRGANGVILVTTRRPRDSEQEVRWNSSFAYTGGFSHNHSIGVGGTGAATTHNISASFRRISGSIYGNDSSYGSLKGNFETQANKVVWFGLNALLSAGKSSSPTGVTYLGLPSMTMAMRDASLSPRTSERRWALDYDDDTEDYRGLLSTWLRLNFSRTIFLKMSAGVDYQTNTRIIWYDNGTDLGAVSESNPNGGAAATLTSLLVSPYVDAVFTFNRYISTDHHIQANLGTEILGNINRFNTMNGQNFVSHELRGNGLRLGAYDLHLHKFMREYVHGGVYATLSYDFKNLAGIKGVVRIDHTPKYKSREDHIYPAVEAFANLRELFFPDLGIVSALKIKTGFGVSGKEKLVPYNLFGNYLSSSWYEPSSGTSTFFDGLDHLRTSEYNASAELGLFPGMRLVIGAGFYYRNTTDRFIMYRMGHPRAAGSEVWEWGGCRQVFERVSKVRNSGYEYYVKAAILNGRDFRWNIGANLAYNVNRVTSSNAEDFYGKVVGHGVYCTCNALDLPISSLYGYKADKAGNYIDITGEGRIDDADKTILGNSIPIWNGGLQTDFSFRNLTLSLQLEGAAGHDIANVNEIVKDGVVDQQGLICLSSKYIEKGDYLRLSHVGVKYRLPLKLKYVRSVDLRFSCHNITTLTSYSGWNPDVNCFGVSTLTNGLDYGSYPLVRSYILGISASF